MQFLIIAYDGKDDQAIDRRMAVRADHVAQGDQMVADGSLVFGTAILDDTGKMIGSVMVLEFPSREEFDEWYKTEPYVYGNVWDEVEILPTRVGPSFAGRFGKS